MPDEYGTAMNKDACDVCSGRVALKDAVPGTVLCSRHFIDVVFPVTARKPLTQATVCDNCGWPFARTQPDCPGPHKEEV